VEYWQAPGHKHGFFNRTSRQRTLLQKADRFLSSLGLLDAGTKDSPAVQGGLKLMLKPATASKPDATPSL
jgi:hypothetical protein